MFLSRLVLSLCTLAAPLLSLSAADRITPTTGTSIALVGGGQGARMLHDTTFETLVYHHFTTQQLVIRNMCDDGDTPAYRDHSARENPFAFPGGEKFFALSKTKDQHGSAMTGKGFAESPDQWLTRTKADVIIGMFGYAESFGGPAKLQAFKDELDAWLKYTATQKYNGKNAPIVVLVSPPAIEDLSATQDAPDGKATNANLALYTKAISDVAAAHDVLFVDAYTASFQWYADSAEPLTRDGWAYTAAGFAKLSPLLVDGIFSGGKPGGDKQKIAAAVAEKNWMWENFFKVPNGVHVYGRRYKPFGPSNYPDELKKLEEMVAIRDQAIWAAAAGKAFDVAAADGKTHKLPDVKTNFDPKNKKNGIPMYAPKKEAVEALTVPNGYKVEQFASEKEFPDLANPVQLSFDNRGRLWVATMPAYPHYKPGDPKPDDKLLILEDTNGDGVADKQTVFAGGLHLPIGFEFAPEGVYVSQGKSLLLLRDTDGDDRADVREYILSGFDDHDTHHAISAFCADPSGAFYMAEGTFLHSHVETAYGPIRSTNGGFFRFAPQRNHLERTVRVPIPNPWGIAFDSYGQDFFADTSGPDIRWMSMSTMWVPYGEFAPRSDSLTPKEQRVRPTSGLEFVSSRHFPDDVQGDILINNNIGFLGTKQHAVSEDESGFKLTYRQDLLKSSNGNFRPVDMEFAPDGSLYVVDWQNMLIGHMQHNARDPNRDHSHGRVYRITYPGRPLVEPAKIVGADIDTLFNNLMLPEYRTRYRTRRELRGRPVADVLAGLKSFLGRIKADDPQREHHLLEGLWVTWGINQVDEALLKQLLTAKDHRVRAAAVRVLRYNTNRIADATSLLMTAAGDDHGRVRIEAVNAASWLGPKTGLAVLAEAKKHPVDKWQKSVYGAVDGYLTGKGVITEDEPKVVTDLTGEAKRLFEIGADVYRREGHCITCHQADGEGLPAAQFPPLAKSSWVTGSPERLIRLTLHGLLGPIEVNGKQYQGLVPMTPFKGLSDEELAGVLTYVRNNFDNKATPITPDQVKAQREATKDQNGFLNPADLLKQFPK